MRKNDLVDLRVAIGKVLKAVDALEAHDAYWAAEEGEIPPDLREVGRLRQALFVLQETIVRVKRLKGEKVTEVRWTTQV